MCNNTTKSKMSYLTGRSLKAYLDLETKVKEREGIIVGQYINTSTKIEFQCKNGHKFIASPGHVKSSNSWCKKCSNNCPEQAKESFYDSVAERGGPIIGEYINKRTKVLVRCSNGHEFDCIPTNTKNKGAWCPKCYGNCPDQARESFYNIVEQRGGCVVGKYINSHVKVKIRCQNNHEWDANPTDIKTSNSWCPKCSDKCPIQSKERFYAKVQEKEGIILGSYINATTKVLIKCNKHHQWLAEPHSITSHNTWCPHCNLSKGEEAVRNVLTKYQILFQEQFVIPQLPKKKFDFYFYYNEHHYLLEYDGGQHFEFVEHFHKDHDTFLTKQKVDAIKYQVPISMGYYVIRIDHESLSSIEQHIVNALNSNQQIYLSNPEMYLYLNQQVTMVELKLHTIEEYINYISNI